MNRDGYPYSLRQRRPGSPSPSATKPPRQVRERERAKPRGFLEPSFKKHYTESVGLRQTGMPGSEDRLERGASMTPLDRELLLSSVVPDGQMSLPAAAYTDDSVLGWEMEHFFDESWVCVGRSEDLRDPGDRRAVALGHERALLVRDEAAPRAESSSAVRTTLGPTGSTGAFRERRGSVEISGSTGRITRSYRSVSPSGTGGSSSTPAGTPRRSRSTWGISVRRWPTTAPASS
jgi:hypothetical protein